MRTSVEAHRNVRFDRPHVEPLEPRWMLCSAPHVADELDIEFFSLAAAVAFEDGGIDDSLTDDVAGGEPTPRSAAPATSGQYQAAVAAGKEVPLDYLAWAAVYCLLYSSIALLLALALFEDRDLA